jgi:PKD repeat protein
VSYAWTFGDGATGTGATPSHVYRKAGTYAVVLTVSTGAGATEATAAILHVVQAARVTKVTGRATRRGAFVVASVSGAGILTAAGHTVTVRRAKTVTLALVLTKAQLRALARHRPVKLKVQIGFVPVIGGGTLTTAAIVLRRV